MLKITIELAPYGNTKLQETISTFVIHNIGKSEDQRPTGDTYDYKIGRSLTSPSVIFQHNRGEGPEKCVMLGIQAARVAGLDKF